MGGYTSITAIAAGLGSCLASGCMTLATAGTVDGPRGVRCLLLWVNMIFLACAVVFQRGDQAWLGSSCSYIKGWNAPDLGICHCELLPQVGVVDCRQTQLVLRIGAAAEVEFLFLVLLGISGCANGAGRSWPLMKFLALPVLLFGFCFVPNQIFDTWRSYAGLVAAGFSVFQAITLIDITMRWNDGWFEKARQGHLRHDAGEFRCWTGLLLLFSVVFMGLGGYLAFDLSSNFAEADLRMVIFGTLGVTFVLLLISILECVKHGSLIVSAAFMVFAQYLAWQAVSVAPTTGPEPRAAGPPMELEAALAVVALIFAAIGEQDSAPPAPAAPRTMELVPTSGADVEAGAKDGSARVLVVQQPQEQAAPPIDACDFVRACLTQSVATAYVTALLINSPEDPLHYQAHLAALVLSVALYGWSLVAPSVLTNRRFD